MRKSDGVRVHHEKRSDWVRDDHVKKRDGLRVHHEKKSTWVRVVKIQQYCYIELLLNHILITVVPYGVVSAMS